MGRKSVLHLIETSEPGGAETVLASVASGLDSTRFRSLICLLEEGWLTGRLRELDIPYTVIENTTPYDPVFLYRLIRLIRREKISLMHSHEFMMTVYGAVASRLTGVPLICTIHGKLYFPERRRRIRALKLAVSLSARTIAVSEDLHRYLVNELGFTPSKIATIYNGIDVTTYSPRSSSEKSRRRLAIPADSLVAGTVGSLFKVKGLPYLLQAAKELKRRYPNFLLLIAGEGDQQPALQENASELGLGDTVSFLGFRKDVPDLLAALDVYVCTSISEGLSLSILEAMAMSKPVVATNVGGNPELVLPEVNGFLVPPAQPSILADKVGELLDDSNLRRKLGRKGREIIEEKFTLEAMINSYQGLYERLLAQ
jgi:glycosyltransferase involved in cell wall biosynthesis